MLKNRIRHLLLAGAAIVILPGHGFAQSGQAPATIDTQTVTGATPAAAPGVQVAAADTTQVAAAETTQVAANTSSSFSRANDQGVEQVVVTARRRAEDIQDVPISVQAISGDTLDEKGTIDLQSLIAQTPGLNSTGGNPRNFSVLIRGIGYAPTAADGLDNAIGVYIDGVYQARPGQVLQDLVDVDSFEVLRGPQGTLFGRNAAAGALNITTNAPSFNSSQTFEASAGNNSFFQGKAILTGPITDNLAYRTTVFYGTNAAGWLPTPSKSALRMRRGLEGIYAPTASHQTITVRARGVMASASNFSYNASDKLSINIDGDVELENDSSAGFSSGGGISTLYGPGNWGINTTAAQQATVTKPWRRWATSEPMAACRTGLRSSPHIPTSPII